ncbi:chromophore lyase CpcT/CpeT [Sphaerospermopsis aphanizomenoides BCCUSP55]|uniref:chromophore lyase CpcT/CpeT n=1 Tax=Sphaerospermopsis aphanizomenoides TaxID=459663 RepID=UPI0019070931|nr:chromophore lyase CpcT/CpeT [Sphaerospermopsis aphanizomenoides]MBK1990017.1 chromophore lyase CpcT/CpeT [Sphaerospermopsis aphanizomenoides BCCUSP55]
MSLSSQLITLGQYLTGEFNNREQAMAEPVWYVHLRLWQRPINIFLEDSITLFAEQANIVNLDQPYRQRIMRLTQGAEGLQVQYYMPKDPSSLKGAGNNPALLNSLTSEQLDLLPSCILSITQETLAPNLYRFTASPPPETLCSFTYLGNSIQVALGFEVTHTTFLSYDKGIDSETGKATWGAVVGPYRYQKIRNL